MPLEKLRAVMCAVIFIDKNYREGHYRLLINDHKIFNSIVPNAMD